MMKQLFQVARMMKQLFQIYIYIYIYMKDQVKRHNLEQFYIKK